MARMSAKLLKGHDLVRFCVMAALSIYFLYRIQMSTVKLLEWRMGSTEMSKTADEMLLPSVTFCPESYFAPPHASTNITEAYEEVPGLRNLLLGMKHAFSVRNMSVSNSICQQ